MLPSSPRSAADLMASAQAHLAHNYAPFPVVFTHAAGMYLYDSAETPYLDMLSAYSALPLGHGHPEVVAALMSQATCLSLTSRCFHTVPLIELAERLTALSGLPRMLPMNTGMEAVETAIKAARKWAYEVKGVSAGAAEVIGCRGNFHGRSITVTGLSTEAQYRHGFGPFPGGLRTVPYGDLAALAAAITPNTAAFLVEPVQGEAGIIVPPPGYLKAARDLCRQRRVLFIVDEVQTGLGRTGAWFAFQHDQLDPDGMTLGKALGGGLLPISCFLATDEVMSVFTPGDHGSTFGGNPLACAVALRTLEVMARLDLPARAATLGRSLLAGLREVEGEYVRTVRGQGLFAGLELEPNAPYSARDLTAVLLQHGVVTKDTHDSVIRFAPPLICEPAHIEQTLIAVQKALDALDRAS